MNSTEQTQPIEITFNRYMCVVLSFYTTVYNVILAAICHVGCRNGGTCIKPDTCQCPYGHSGRYCGTGKFYSVYDSLHHVSIKLQYQ